MPVHEGAHPLARALPPWLDRALYPFVPRRLPTAAGELSYVDEGNGPPVLLVHGTPSWSFEWRGVIRALAQSHRVIAPDHLGFGLSDKPKGADLTIEAHKRRLGSLVAALGLRDFTLVVHDFGGPIGLPLALEPNSRVGRVVVLNSWMWPSDGDPTLRRIDRIVRSPLGRFLYLWLGFSARVILPSAFGDKRRLTKAIHRQYLRPLVTRQDREGTYAFARALLGADAHYAELWRQRHVLRQLPMVIVWGDRDPVLTAVHRDRWVEAFPAARLVRVADAGHFVAEERPEVVAEAVKSLSAPVPRG